MLLLAFLSLCKTCRNSIFDPFFIHAHSIQKQKPATAILLRKFCIFLYLYAPASSFITSTLTQFNNNNSNKINTSATAFSVTPANSSHGTQIIQFYCHAADEKILKEKKKSSDTKQNNEKYQNMHTHTQERHITSQWCETKAKKRYTDLKHEFYYGSHIKYVYIVYSLWCGWWVSVLILTANCSKISVYIVEKKSRRTV